MLMRVPVLLILLCGLMLPGVVRAEDKPAETARPTAEQPTTEQPTAASQPLAIISVASLDRVMGDVKQVFTVAERDDLNQLVQGVLGALNNLKGVDPGKPGGVMFFLEGQLGSQPEVVTFLPISKLEDLQTSLQIGPIRLQPQKEPNWYILDFPENQVHATYQNGYLYFAPAKKTLERPLTNPEALTKPLAEKYDIAGAIYLKHVPADMRNAVMDLVRAQAEMDKKQKADETAEQFEFRKKLIDTATRNADMLLAQADQVTLGAKLTEGESKFVVEFQMDAKPDTELAKSFEQLNKNPNSFAAWNDGKAPFTSTVNLTASEEVTGLLEQVLGMASQQGLSQVPDDDKPVIRDLLAEFQAMLKSGHLNLGVQILGEPPEKFALRTGLKVQDGAKLAQTVDTILDRLQNKYAVGNVERGVAKVGEVAIHKITPDNLDNNARLLYGTDPQIYLAVSGNVLWLTFGEDNALAALKDLLAGETAAAKTDLPVQTTVRFSSWLGVVAEADDANPDFLRLATKAFAGGGDQIQFQMKSTASGLQAKLEFEQGFLKLLGLAISEAIDNGN